MIQDTPPWKRNLRKNLSDSKYEQKPEIKAFTDPKPKPTVASKNTNTQGSPKRDHKAMKYVYQCAHLCT